MEQRESYHNYMGRRMREEDAKMATENALNNAQRSIWVTFNKEGVHMYPGADSDPKLATGDWDDVSFLGIAHRHIFHFRVRIEVFHNDRDIEFIQFKRWLERLYSEQGTSDGDVLVLNHRSCEMIADELYEKITTKFPSRFVEIEVAEDGENGCSIYYPKC
jgi:3'-phosphoadenosine 5'-phosphosulfate sulfotransferase (PAPS reductase)/FAD synthetase